MSQDQQCSVLLWRKSHFQLWRTSWRRTVYTNCSEPHEWVCCAWTQHWMHWAEATLTHAVDGGHTIDIHKPWWTFPNRAQYSGWTDTCFLNAIILYRLLYSKEKCSLCPERQIKCNWLAAPLGRMRQIHCVVWHVHKYWNWHGYKYVN